MSNQNARSEDSYIFHDILPAFADYGYPIYGDTENLKIKGDIKIKIGSQYKETDVVYYASDVPVLLVEAKKPGQNIREAEKQACSYIRNFPIKEYSKDGRPPQYAAVTIGKKICFYRYRREINEYGGIIDRLEMLDKIFTYAELKDKYGIETTSKPAVTPATFKSIFYELLSALDSDEEQKVTPELVLKTVRLFYEFLKDPREYTTIFPYTALDGHPVRKRWIRNLLNQYDWSNLGAEVADQFRAEILRSFQGSSQLNQYITPWTVISFMTELVEVNPADKVLDFECGSGGFIASAVREGVPLENVKGVDIADLPYYVSKLFLALNFNITGEGIDQVPIHRDNGLYGWGDDWSVVIGNPAGGSKYDPEEELNDLDKVYEHLDKTMGEKDLGDKPSEYALSIQQAIKSCQVGGRISLVLPEGFYANSSDEFLRNYVASYCKVRAIVSLPRGVFRKGTTTKSVFSGSTTSHQKMSILFLEKFERIEDSSETLEDYQNLDYSVFLTSIKKPEQAGSNPDDWLEEPLAKVLREWKHWEENHALVSEEETIAPIDKKRKISMPITPAHQEELIKIKGPLFDEKEAEKPTAPDTKTETVIPDEFDDLFED